MISVYVAAELYTLPTYGNALPLMQVTGSSMLPTYHPGEWLIYYTPDKQTIQEGSVIMFEKNLSRAPVVHRVVEILPDGSMITKGDNNPGTDQEMGFDAQNVWPCDIVGIVAGPLQLPDVHPYIEKMYHIIAVPFGEWCGLIAEGC